MIRIPFIVFGFIMVFTEWPLREVTIIINETLNITPIIFLLLMHYCLYNLFSKALYKAGIMIAAVLTIMSIFIGGAIGQSIDVFFGSGETQISNEYDLILLKKFVSIMTYIPFLVVCILSIPFKRIENYFLMIKGKKKIRSVYIIVSVRMVEHVIFVVLPRTLDFLREEDALSALKHRHSMSVLNVLMVGIVVEFIISAFEFLPIWIDELTAMEEVGNG